jgi:hypothetical protein
MPEYYYFEAGNGYIGSLNGMNFKIANGEKLDVYLYHGSKSFDKSEPYLQKDFEKTADGYANLISWLEDEYLKHKESEFYSNRLTLK